MTYCIHPVLIWFISFLLVSLSRTGVSTDIRGLWDINGSCAEDVTGKSAVVLVGAARFREIRPHLQPRWQLLDGRADLIFEARLRLHM